VIFFSTLLDDPFNDLLIVKDALSQSHGRKGQQRHEQRGRHDGPTIQSHHYAPADHGKQLMSANPWDRPPIPEIGESRAEPLFQAVGRAISHWEHVEQSIATLFSFITTGKFYDLSGPALRAYGSISGTGARVEMVRAAVESWAQQYPQCPLIPNCNQLLKECSNWSSRRNEIAHGQVDCLVDAIPNGWMLFPGLFDTKKRSVQGKSKYRYTVDHIEQFSAGFLSLHGRINECTSALAEWHRINLGSAPSAKPER
jgi:hypothetical protein